MNFNQLVFNQSQFDRLFPFFLLINYDLTIDSCGSSVKKMASNCPLKFFPSCFAVSRPEVQVNHFDDLNGLCGQLVVLKINNQFDNILRGQFEYMAESKQLLFVGSPWFNSMEQVAESSLTLDDFAMHDPQIDMLHLLKIKEIDNQDLKHLLVKVNSQKNELNKAAEEINDIALFPMQSPDPLLRISTQGEILLQNPRAHSLAYFEYNKQTFGKEDFWKHISKNGSYFNDRWSFEVESGGKAYSFICRYLPDYHYFNVYGHEITEKKKNQEELQRLSLLASVNDNGVFFADSLGKITWANNGFCVLTGFSFEEVIGKKTTDFSTKPPNKEIVQTTQDALTESISLNHELIYYRKDGTWFWARVRGQSYQNNNEGEPLFFAIVEDISGEKKQAEQLRVLSQIAESNINGVVITDKDGNINWANKSYMDMSGYSMCELMGKKPGHILQGKQSDPDTIKYLRTQINHGNPFSTEIINYNKEKHPYWVRISGQPFYNAEAELSGYFALVEDITTEKALEQQLKRSENQVRTALEKVGDNVWEHNFKTGKTIFTKSNDEFIGKLDGDLDDLAKTYWEKTHPDDLHLLQQNDLGYKNAEIDSHMLEYRIVKPDGSIAWVLDRGIVIEKDKKGKPVRLVGTHTNITNIKQTETELEQRVMQFKSLSENVPGVVYEYEFNHDGTEGLRYVSPTIERILGIGAEDFKNYLNYIHPDDHGSILSKNLLSKTKLEPFYYEARLTIPGTRTKWVSFHSSYSYTDQNGSKIFTGYMMDISARKNIEHTLRNNEEKYRSIIENMNLGLLEVDNDEHITYANQSFCEMSGYRFAELMGKNAGALFAKPDDRPVLEAKLQKRLDGVADAYELEVVNKQKENKWWLISGAPRYNDKGELTGSIGIHLDITEQKNLERELIDSRNEAERLAKTKEMFLANMSHEIRTPMNAIVGMANQLGKSYLNTQQRFYLDVINTASDNLLVIINDILDLSKIEAGKLSLENIGFEPLAVAKRAIQVLSHRAEEKGLKLNTSFFDPGIAAVLIGDPYRLNQVLLNLIGNSIKFTDNGSVDLAFRLLINTEDSQKLQVEVADTGMGMDEEFVKHLFDKFSQENESITRKFGGTGLGMSICSDLINLMGGRISAESKKGMGTTISFTLELKKGNINDLPNTHIAKFKPDFLSGRKILVTDDNELNRLVASILLQSYGAEILESYNGEHALEMLKTHKPDIILMDIQMPVMNGIVCTRNIRRIGISTPVIALTAQAIKGESEKCHDAGMNDYITKPFRENDFLAVINKWLGDRIVNESNENKVLVQNNIVFKEVLDDDDDEITVRSENALFDLSTLIEISKGHTEFVKKMVRTFCDLTPDMLIEMREAHENKQFDKLAAVAHKMKPSIETLNINTLNSVVLDIETMGKNNIDTPKLAAAITLLVSTLKTVIEQMTEIYPADN